MRVRNVKNKKEILKNHNKVILNPKEYLGKWNTLFNNQNPIHIEIGMGKGRFIKEMAKRYPNINFIGIERQDSILAIAVRDYKEEFDNLYFICIDASKLNEVFKKEVDTIYLNFSDPWPKRRHTKRRLTHESFLKVYDELFKDEKHIIQKTDNYLLFESSLESLSKYGYVLNKVNLNLHKEKDTNNVLTEYEEKFSKKGYLIYKLEALKYK